MGNCPFALLVGAHVLGSAVTAVNCPAHTELACHSQPGCRWYEYRPSEECRLCDTVHPVKTEITGCRDWTPAYYCKRVFNEFTKHAQPHKFKENLKNYQVSQGSGEAGNPRSKKWSCRVWCDTFSPFACEGQPSALEEFRGVNYGGRFVPEKYLGLPGTDELFFSVSPPASVKGHPVRSASLCDVGRFTDAHLRLSRFLDANIKEEHFYRMAELGFNVVRLPLGYWNVLDLPGSSTPNGDSSERWRWLQLIMPAKAYRKWIDLVFVYARRAGLRVLLDLHGAPGAQNGNAFTGCDEGKGNYNFNTPWNKKLAVHAIERMAMICKEHAAACYGIELLNEPEFDDNEPFRVFLRGFYEEAILAARKHVDRDTPLLVMDWTHWLPWWRQQNTFGYHDYGRVVLATHLYDGMGVQSQSGVREQFLGDFNQIEAAYFGSKYEVIVSEYGLSGHSNTTFDLHSLASWLVHELRQRSLGSAVWNYDAAARDWGPVASASRAGVDWVQIFEVQRRADGVGWGWAKTVVLLLVLLVTALMAVAGVLVKRLQGKREEQGEEKGQQQQQQHQQQHLLELGDASRC